MLAIVSAGPGGHEWAAAAASGAGESFVGEPGDEGLTDRVFAADALLLVTPVVLLGLPGGLKAWLDSWLEIRPDSRRTARTGGKPAGYLAYDAPGDPEVRALVHAQVRGIVAFLGYEYRDGIMATRPPLAAAERLGAILAGRVEGYAAYPEEYLRGIACFNAGEFWEAHEEWEAIWLEAETGFPLFFQGLIQVAAAFHHFGNGNWAGMAALFAQGIGKLEAYRPVTLGLDVDGFLHALGPWRALAEAGGPRSAAPGAPPRIDLA